ncbi:MAG: MATE family efflux transporter [candidate division WOR-3 bacterium]
MQVKSLNQHGLNQAIWSISGPVMLSSLLFTFMSTVDMFWVGKLGHFEIAAVSLAGSVIGVIHSLAGIVSSGTLATCARFAGAGDRDGIRESLFHSLLFSASVALFLALVTAPMSSPLLRLFGAESRVVSLGAPYLSVSLLALPFFFVSAVLASAFQALGDTRTPMWVALAANAVNIVLDPVLILGWLHCPRLGILGAALATAAAQLMGTIALAVLLRRHGLIRLRQAIRPRIFSLLFRIGGPASLQAVTRPLTGMVLFRIVASFGSGAIAAVGIGLRILSIMYVYLGGLGAACQTLVGQSLGARRIDMANRVADRVLKLGLVLQFVVLTLLFAFAPGVVRIFNSNADVVHKGTLYLRILAPFLVLLGPATAWSGAQFGAGDTRPTMAAAIVANWLVKLPLAHILSRMSQFDLSGVWLGIAVSVLVETAIVAVTFFRGGWHRKEFGDWRPEQVALPVGEE